MLKPASSSYLVSCQQVCQSRKLRGVARVQPVSSLSASRSACRLPQPYLAKLALPKPSRLNSTYLGRSAQLSFAEPAALSGFAGRIASFLPFSLARDAMAMAGIAGPQPYRQIYQNGGYVLRITDDEALVCSTPTVSCASYASIPGTMDFGKSIHIHDSRVSCRLASTCLTSPETS